MPECTRPPLPSLRVRRSRRPASCSKWVQATSRCPSWVTAANARMPRTCCRQTPPSRRAGSRGGPAQTPAGSGALWPGGRQRDCPRCWRRTCPQRSRSTEGRPRRRSRSRRCRRRGWSRLHGAGRWQPLWLHVWVSASTRAVPAQSSRTSGNSRHWSGTRRSTSWAACFRMWQKSPRTARTARPSWAPATRPADGTSRRRPWAWSQVTATCSQRLAPSARSA
mmetsp:Transcript_10809/g.24414  ORF Transcript_10809/g.24414 Transcript_10809/m.24414 type:complete len:222 (+) Transcript_10809:148-813(+)